MRRFVAAALVVGMWAGVAGAQTPKPKEQKIDFTTTSAIEGELKKPEGSLIPIRSKVHFDSMIRIRGDFAPELTGSADNVR